MHRTLSTASRFAMLLLVAGTLTCGGDGQGPAGSPTKLAVATQPAAAAETAVILSQQPVVQVQDADGQAIPASGTTVTAEVVQSGVVLDGTLAREVDSQGRATFTDLSLSGPAGAYTLRFTASGLTAATSNDITLAGVPATATITVTTQPPTTALTGEVFDPASQPAVTLLDAAGNPMTSVNVTASKASGSGTLEGGPVATTDAAGVAKFQDLGITGTGAHTIQFTAGTLTATSSTMTLSALPPEASTGRWGNPVPWDIVPLHIHLLPTGKILAWGKFENGGAMAMGNPRLWDPAAGTPLATDRTIAADTMLFCSGHAFMPDGRLMVSGGHKLDDRGLDVTNFFNPVTESWTPGPKMAKGRWYPTVTELPDGRMVTVAGKDTSKTTVQIPEVWENGAWRQLTGASLLLPYYPRDFVAPDGRVFMAGERTTSRWLDVNAGGGAGSWTSGGPAHIWLFNRDYGSAVMYDEGKILYVGGGGDVTWDTPDAKSPTPTATAEKIDLNSAGAVWVDAGSLPTPRRHLNATVLPDGEVLVTGGLSGGGFNNLATGQRAAEIWDPATNNWTTLASNSVTRGYHSVSLLLPDATVLHGGSGNATDPATGLPIADEESHEIFQPPYLFKGARPAISSAPPTVGYTSSFQVTTPNVGQVATVRIIRLGSVTHAFDQNGRAMTLLFTSSVGGISVTAPDSPNLAPPGDYMLFILNRNGVPSAGKIIRIQ